MSDNKQYHGESRVNSETTIIEHDFDLSNKELLVLGEEIGALDLQEDQVEAEKRAVMAGWKARIGDIKSNKKRLLRVMRDKKETREVECTFDYDYKAGTVHFTSVETGEELMVRDMTKDELQMPLFDESTNGELNE